MTLSKREKWIVGAGVAVLAVLVVDQLMVSPYLARRASIDEALTNVKDDLSKVNTLLGRQRKLAVDWKRLQAGGLKTDASDAQSQALHTLNAYAEAAGVTLESLRLEHPAQEGDFQVVSFNVKAAGAMRAVARLMWALESSPIPLRVSDMQCSAQHDGADDVSLALTVSTLAMPPHGGTPTTGPSTAPLGEVALPGPTPDAYALAGGRSLFLKGRSTSDGAGSSVHVPAPEESLVFNGVTQTDNGMVAFVEDTSAGRVLRVRVGDAIARGHVSQITLNSLEYASAGGVAHVNMGQTLAGVDAWNITYGVAGDKPAAGVTAAGAAAGAGVPAASAGGDVILRMQQRRQHELAGQ